MLDFRHIVRGSAYLAIGSQLGRVIGFVQVVLLTKYLGSAGYGAWSLIQALPGMLLVMTDFGVNSRMLIAVARDKAQERVSLQQVLSIKLFLAPLYILAVYLIARTFGRDSHVITWTTLYAVCMVANLCGESLIAVWRAHERFALEAKITLAKDVTLSALLILALILGCGLGALIVVSLIHSLLISILLLRWYRKHNPLSLTFSSLRDYVRQIRAATPYAIYNLLNPLSMQIAVVMLGWFSVLSSVGIYNAGYRVILFLYFIPNALQRTLLPRLSLQYHSSRLDYANTLDKALRLVLMISLPAAIGLWLTARSIVALLFSPEFRGAGQVLALLALSAPLYYVRVVMNAALYAANREKISLVVYAAATALNGAANCVLIPRFDCAGAAWGTILAEFTLCAAYSGLVAGDYPLTRLLAFTAKVLLACGFMASVVWIATAWPLPLKVSVGAAVYVCALFALKVVRFNHVRRYWSSGPAFVERAS